MPRPRASVHPDLGGTGERRGDHVDSSVAVQIGKGAASVPRRRRGVEPGLFGQGLPLSAGAQVTKHRVVLVNALARLRERPDVSPRDEQVLPAVVVEIEQPGTEACHVQGQDAHPAFAGDLPERPLTRVQVQGKSLIVQGDQGDVRESVVVHVAKIHAHAGNEIPVLRQRHPGGHSHFLELVPEIVEQRIVVAVVGDKQIGTPVQVVVRHADAHALADMAADSPLRGDVPERAVAVIQEKRIRLPFVEPRMAVVGGSLKAAQRLVAVLPLQIVENEKIEQPVVIDVDPGRRDGPQRAEFRIVGVVQSGLGGDVGEGAVAIVVIQSVAVNARHEDVGISVVIVIANSHANVVPGACQPRDVRHVREYSVAVVAEQAVPVLGRVLPESGDVGAIGKEDVGPAVAIVVEHGYPAGHGLRRVTSGSLVAFELECNGLIRESDRGRRGRGWEECQRGQQQRQNNDTHTPLFHRRHD